MITNFKQLGIIGEKHVADFLVRNNYVILDKNFHSRFGEIDIIAKNFEVLAFVEVKTRRKNLNIPASESVNITKQKKILKTAMMFIQEHNFNIQPRFDVAEVLYDKNNGGFEINYIESAFLTEGDDNYSFF